jgi:hypothetical protein
MTTLDHCPSPAALLHQRHAHQLLDRITAAGGTPPARLPGLLTVPDKLAQPAAGPVDPLGDLVDKIADGDTIDPEQVDKRIAAAAQAANAAEYRQQLRQRAEQVSLRKFHSELRDGLADEILDGLRPAFTEHAKQLAAIRELIDPDVDAETFIRQASAEQLDAWRAIDDHNAALTRIADVVEIFGPTGDFQQVAHPTQLGHIVNTGTFNARGLFLTRPDIPIAAACAAMYANGGQHRASCWYRAANWLQLNTIEQTQERVRAFCEAWFDGQAVDQGRGSLDPADGFVQRVTPNPYAKAEADQ